MQEPYNSTSREFWDLAVEKGLSNAGALAKFCGVNISKIYDWQDSQVPEWALEGLKGKN